LRSRLRAHPLWWAATHLQMRSRSEYCGCGSGAGSEAGSLENRLCRCGSDQRV
jgi:hypothetical protein